MKKIFFLLVFCANSLFCILFPDPATLVEDSQKMLECLQLRSLSAYGYIYNFATTTPQTICSGQAIPFSSHFPATMPGITHTARSNPLVTPVTAPCPSTPASINALNTSGDGSQITIVATGTYFVSFVVYAIQANQFALFLQQGSPAINTALCNTNYGIGTAYSPNSGFAIIQTTSANAILTLVNYTPFTSQGAVPQTTLAYNNNTQGGLLCNSTVGSNIGGLFNSFNGGLQINTINAALYIQKLD